MTVGAARLAGGGDGGAVGAGRGGHGRRRPPARAGYTLIEVMMAVGIMTVGAVGIMALQQATTRGNVFAREMTVATDATRTWLERIRRDALGWNQAGLTGVASTQYLRNAPAAPGALGDWFVPDTSGTAALGDGVARDFQGAEVPAGGAGPVVYCTNVRLTWMMGNAALRADVRTWWHRANAGAAPIGCADANMPAVDADLASDAPRLHAVYGTVIVRPTPSNR